MNDPAARSLQDRFIELLPEEAKDWGLIALAAVRAEARQAHQAELVALRAELAWAQAALAKLKDYASGLERDLQADVLDWCCKGEVQAFLKVFDEALTKCPECENTAKFLIDAWVTRWGAHSYGPSPQPEPEVPNE